MLAQQKIQEEMVLRVQEQEAKIEIQMKVEQEKEAKIQDEKAQKDR